MKNNRTRKGLAALLALVLIFTSISAFAEEVETQATIAKPVISFSLGSSGKIELNITCATSNVDIRYTYVEGDGTPSNPTSSKGEVYDEDNKPAFDEYKDYTIKAIAYKGSSSSSVVTAKKLGYRVGDKDTPALKLTYFKPIGSDGPPIYGEVVADKGVYGGKKVTFRYSLNGRPVTEDSPEIPEKLKIEKTTKLTVKVFCQGYLSTMDHTYEVQADGWPDAADSPSFTLERTYSGRRIIISSDTPGSVIRYKFGTSSSLINDGDNLTAADTEVYTAPIEIPDTNRYYIRAYTTKDDMHDSAQNYASIKIDRCTEPTISVASSTGGRKKVTIKTTEKADSGFEPEIYYTTDGSEPTAQSTKYTDAFIVSKTCTVKAIVARKGSIPSYSVSQRITASGGSVEAPYLGKFVTSPGGTKAIPLLTDSTSDYQIYYRKDANGKLYTSEQMTKSASTLYDGKPIEFTTPGRYGLTAVTYSGTVRSAVFQVYVNVTDPTELVTKLENGVKVITFTPEAGKNIYYTLTDGLNKKVDVPHDDAHLYTYPITVSRESTISSVAVDVSDKTESIPYYLNVTVPEGPITPETVGAITVKHVSGGITLSCATEGADIFYACDNSPSTVVNATSTRYQSGTVINTTGRSYIHAVAMKPGFTSSTFSGPTAAESLTATPEIKVGSESGGRYTITLSCATPDVTYYYTTDGSDPTTENSEGQTTNAYPFVYVEKGRTLKVMAKAADLPESEIAVRIIGSDIKKCEDIYATVEGEYEGISIMMLPLTSGASIYYTTDGTTPSASNGTRYVEGQKVIINTPGTVVFKAVATLSGIEDSDILEKTFNMIQLGELNVASRSTDVDGVPATAVQLSYKGTERPEFFYTLDGTQPSGSSLQYPQSQPYITVFDSSTLKAAAMKKADIDEAEGQAITGYVPGPVLTYRVNVEKNVVAQPKPTGEYVMGGFMVTLTCATPGASIYYSTDGSRPNILYTGPIFAGDPSITIYAMAVKAGYKDTAIYSIPCSRMLSSEMPTASVDTNSVVESGTEIALECGTYTNPDTEEKEDYTIFYTTDGSEPTLESERYTAPIVVTGNTVIKAAAAGIGSALSPTAVFFYRTEDAGVTITPSLIHEGGYIEGSVQVEAPEYGAMSGTAIAAIYSGDTLVEAVSTELGESMTFDFADTECPQGSVVVKVFVFDSLSGIEPLCKAELTVAD